MVTAPKFMLTPRTKVGGPYLVSFSPPIAHQRKRRGIRGWLVLRRKTTMYGITDWWSLMLFIVPPHNPNTEGWNSAKLDPILAATTFGGAVQPRLCVVNTTISKLVDAPECTILKLWAALGVVVSAGATRKERGRELIFVESLLSSAHHCWLLPFGQMMSYPNFLRKYRGRKKTTTCLREPSPTLIDVRVESFGPSNLSSVPNGIFPLGSATRFYGPFFSSPDGGSGGRTKIYRQLCPDDRIQYKQF